MLKTTKKIKEIYEDIQKKIFYMIPEKWDELYLYASVIERFGSIETGELFFYYIPKGILRKNPINVYEIPAKFNLEEAEYLRLVDLLYSKIKELREEFKKIEGCETHEEVIARSSDFFNDMILPNEKKYQHIAVFSHGAWIHSLLTYIYQREIKEYWHAPRQENCGVTTIQIEDGVCHVLKESEIFYNKDGE